MLFLLETFYEDKWKGYIKKKKQNNTNTMQLMGGISCWSILLCLDCTKHNENNMHFWHGQNMSPTEWGVNILNLSIEQQRRIRMP